MFKKLKKQKQKRA